MPKRHSCYSEHCRDAKRGENFARGGLLADMRWLHIFDDADRCLGGAPGSTGRRLPRPATESGAASSVMPRIIGVDEEGLKALIGDAYDGAIDPEQRGRLHAATPALSNVLLRHVHHAAQTGAGRGQDGGGTLPLRRRAGGPLHLSVCPLPIETGIVIGLTTPAAIIFINIPAESQAIRQDVIRAFYGLSAAESKLVGALLPSTFVADYADRNGIRVTAAKTQLRSILRPPRTVKPIWSVTFSRTPSRGSHRSHRRNPRTRRLVTALRM